MEKGPMQHSNEKNKLIFWSFVRDFRKRPFSDRTRV